MLNAYELVRDPVRSKRIKMSVPCIETTKECGDKHDIILSESNPAEDSDERKPELSSPPEKRLNENAITTCSKRKGSLDPDINVVSPKKQKCDTKGDRYSSSTPSDLSSGSSREKQDVPQSSKSSENAMAVMKHYNSLEGSDLKRRNQSRIVYMRNFNNWIKSMLLNEFLTKVKQTKSFGSPIKVLDMCCGKGGDLGKLKKGNVTHVIFADIAELSVEECQQRYNDIVNKSSNDRGFAPVFTTEFITGDCTKVRLRERYKDPTIQLDLVSCQFAFHYSFESLPQAECMFRNASENLRPGGYFIGTIPDAKDLVSRWQKCDGNKFGNDVYSVEFLCDDKHKPPLFGAKYNFYLEGVVNCPEFLVHLQTFCKLATKFGLELVMFERFENYYERMKGEGRSLLGKMQALETYPPFHEVPLLGQAGRDYQHAVQYMQNRPGHRKIGTLSQAEWEATSLYAVFAFQKLKTIWNSDGKPEYVKL